MAAVEGICGDGHFLSFYCSTCDALFCGECCTRTHTCKGGFKDHDVVPIEDNVTTETQKKGHLYVQCMKNVIHRLYFDTYINIYCTFHSVLSFFLFA